MPFLSGKLYVIGGCDDEKVRYGTRLLFMDIDGEETAILTPMSNARMHPGVTPSEGRLLVFGGYCNDEMSRCEM